MLLRYLNDLYSDENILSRLKSMVLSVNPPPSSIDTNRITPAEAEDLIGDLYIKLYNTFSRNPTAIDTPEGEESLRRYVFSSARSNALTLIRIKRRRKEVQLSDIDTPISQEYVAKRGMGSFPASIEDKMFLKQVEDQLSSRGRALRGVADRDLIVDLIEWSKDSETGLTDVTKQYLSKYKDFDWDAEMKAAQEEPDESLRQERIEELDQMLTTALNTVGRRLARAREGMRQYFKTSASLSEAAHKLDLLGFTKEAKEIIFLIKEI